MARTVDEILRGLRGLIAEDESVHSGDQIDADAVHHAIQKFADELEAAIKHERDAILADAARLGRGRVEIVYSAKVGFPAGKPVGNAAAKKRLRTKACDPSKILQDYWRDHYEV